MNMALQAICQYKLVQKLEVKRKKLLDSWLPCHKKIRI